MLGSGKSSLSRKAKFERARTGGRPMEVQAVGEFEHQVLQNFGSSAVEGAPGVMATGFQKDPLSGGADAVEISNEISFEELYSSDAGISDVDITLAALPHHSRF